MGATTMLDPVGLGRGGSLEAPGTGIDFSHGRNLEPQRIGARIRDQRFL
jgi:hypothetical protein